MDLLTLIFGLLSLAWLGGLAVIGWAMWKKGQAMTNNDKMIRANFAFILFIIIAVCVNLNTRVRVLETSNSDLQQIIRTQKDELEKVKEKNTMQDVIINKLNNDYNSRMAQQLQEIADQNGVGG